MCPLVYKLIQNSASGVVELHLYLVIQNVHLVISSIRLVIEEPPATEYHKVSKLSGGYAKFVLIFSCKHSNHKFIIRYCLQRYSTVFISPFPTLSPPHPKAGICKLLDTDHHSKTVHFSPWKQE